MLRKKLDEAKHKRELKKIGKKLVELIKLNDEDSHQAALKIIEEHQNDTEVINYQKPGQPTPLMLVCQLGKNEIAERLLATKCVDVNAKGRKKTHALETALLAHNHKMAFLLAKDQRVYINEAGRKGVPTIYIALGAGEFRFHADYPIEIAQAMLSRADIELGCRYVRTRRDVFGLYRYDNKTLLHALIEALDLYEISAKTAESYHQHNVIALCKHNFAVALQLLSDVLAKGVIDINSIEEFVTLRSRSKNTALMLAVESGFPEVVAMLLAAGANTNLRNLDGKRAVDIAVAISTNENFYGHRRCQISDKIVGMIMQEKTKTSVAESPATMFGTLNQIPDVPSVPAEYLAPPKPSAPPEDILPPTLG